MNPANLRFLMFGIFILTSVMANELKVNFWICMLFCACGCTVFILFMESWQNRYDRSCTMRTDGKRGFVIERGNRKVQRVKWDEIVYLVWNEKGLKGKRKNIARIKLENGSKISITSHISGWKETLLSMPKDLDEFWLEELKTHLNADLACCAICGFKAVRIENKDGREVHKTCMVCNTKPWNSKTALREKEYIRLKALDHFALKYNDEAVDFEPFRDDYEQEMGWVAPVSEEEVLEHSRRTWKTIDPVTCIACDICGFMAMAPGIKACRVCDCESWKEGSGQTEPEYIKQNQLEFFATIDQHEKVLFFDSNDYYQKSSLWSPTVTEKEILAYSKKAYW